MNLHLKDNEYLKAFYKGDNKFALQLWVKSDDCCVVKYNLVSNFDSPFDEDFTIKI